MVTEAWVQGDRHRGTVHLAQASSASDRDPETTECGRKCSFIDNNASDSISNNSPAEQSRSSDQTGECHLSSTVVIPLENKDNDWIVQEHGTRNKSHSLVTTERQVEFTKSGLASNKKEDVKTEANVIKQHEISTRIKPEKTSRLDIKETTSNDHITEITPHIANDFEEPLLLEVLRGTPNSRSHKHGDDCYKQYTDNAATSIACEDLSSLTDVHGNPWDTTSGTEFTKSATCKTSIRFQFSENMDVMKARSKIQNYKSPTKPGYSERYGIGSKYFPPTVKKETGISGVRQQATERLPWSFRPKSVNRNKRMTASAGIASKREAAMVGRRVSHENILQCHNKTANNQMEEDDSYLTLDAHSCQPVVKGRQPSRPTDVTVVDEPPTTKGNPTLTVDDVNNNREYKFHYGGMPWVVDEPAPQDCTRGSTIILSVTPGADLKQGPDGRKPVHWVDGYDRGSDLLVIKSLRTQREVAETEITNSYWSTVKQAILYGHSRDTSASAVSDQKIQRSVSARQQQVDTTKVRRPALTRTAPLRKPDKAQQADTKNVSTERDDQPHPTVTNLIEDPILVKVSKRNRNVGKFTCKPDPMPNAVCFEIPGTELRHQDVKLQVEGLLLKFPEVRIVGIQFHNRALVNNQRDMNNRWIITTNSGVGCKLLIGNNLSFDGQEVQLRLYDEVVSTEYQQFVRMTNFVKMMDTRKILS